MSADNGGPAFPQKEPLTDDWQGMTLRDYFAAAIAPTFISLPANGLLNGDEGMTPAECAAKAAYKMADAMLKERSK